MRHFRRHLLMLLFSTALLLFVAWLCLQTIRGGGRLDLDGLLLQGRRIIDELTAKVEHAAQDISRTAGPKLESAAQWARGIFGATP